MANISTEHLHFSIPAYQGKHICLKTHTARVGKYNFQKESVLVATMFRCDQHCCHLSTFVFSQIVKKKNLEKERE
jgi:acyl-CoA hydrolase